MFRTSIFHIALPFINIFSSVIAFKLSSALHSQMTSSNSSLPIINSLTMSRFTFYPYPLRVLKILLNATRWPVVLNYSLSLLEFLAHYVDVSAVQQPKAIAQKLFPLILYITRICRYYSNSNSSLYRYGNDYSHNIRVTAAGNLQDLLLSLGSWR